MKRYQIIIIAMSCYAISQAGCSDRSPKAETINKSASLPADLKFSAKRFRVIALLINKKQGTMSTLYGNEIALRSALAGTQHHTPGLEMALVTWKKKPNPYWYGNNIPGELLTVETVIADKQINKLVYRIRSANSYTAIKDTSDQQARLDYILKQKPSILP